VPTESPTLGFTHLQFEALLTTARESSDPCDFALVAMLGLPGLRIFEATGTDITDLGEQHGQPGAALVRKRHQGRLYAADLVTRICLAGQHILWKPAVVYRASG
jgi:hypothetical protein